MIIIGLTGSIGMGKSTLAKQFAALGAKVSNADVVVHQLLSKGGAGVESVAAAFPGVFKDGSVDRQALGKLVFGDIEKRKLLESILHPLVIACENEFVRNCERLGAKFVVLDIPLLFETGGDARCDITVTVTAPHFIQRQRVMQRLGMSEEKFKNILAAQMSDREKRDRADIVIDTGLGKAYSFRQAKNLLRIL